MRARAGAVFLRQRHAVISMPFQGYIGILLRRFCVLQILPYAFGMYYVYRIRLYLWAYLIVVGWMLCIVYVYIWRAMKRIGCISWISGSIFLTSAMNFIHEADFGYFRLETMFISSQIHDCNPQGFNRCKFFWRTPQDSHSMAKKNPQKSFSRSLTIEQWWERE